MSGLCTLHIEYFMIFDTWCVRWASLAKNTTQRIIFMQTLQEDVKSNVFRLYHVAVIKQNIQTRLFSNKSMRLSSNEI